MELDAEQAAMRVRWRAGQIVMRPVVRAAAEETYISKARKAHTGSGVYVVGSRKLQVYKVGMSSNLQCRLREFSTLPIKLDYVRSWSTAEARKLERRVHQQFVLYRMALNGAVSEWFRLGEHQLRDLELLLDIETRGTK